MENFIDKQAVVEGSIPPTRESRARYHSPRLVAYGSVADIVKTGGNTVPYDVGTTQVYGGAT